MTKREEEIQKTRKIMGTEARRSAKIKTTFYRGVKGIEVKLVDMSRNPYRAIFDMVTATWGNEDYKEKWFKTPLEGRKKVLEAALTHQALTTSLEAPKFTFMVKGVSRSSFDQIARARIGVGVSSMGVRDNSRSDAGFRIPRDLYDDLEAFALLKDHIQATKRVYQIILEKGRSWQDARCVLPMGMTHNFYITFNYLAFQNQCARRLQFCEQPDTVAVFWLMREELSLRFPVLAAYCRPACDIRKRCGYHQAYTLSELFSCLFKGCGRWPTKEDRNTSYFDFPSCTAEEIMQDLDIFIPEQDGWDAIEKNAWMLDDKWKE